MADATRWVGADLVLRRTAAVLGILVVGGLLISHASEYQNFFADDGFISLRYAKRLVQGQGLTWTSGERVEGYTNFLWIILVALGGWVTSLEFVHVARFIGIASSWTFLVAIVAHPSVRSIPGLLCALGVASALASYGPIATWAIGGLEQPLLAAIVAWAMLHSFPIFDTERVRWRDIVPGSLLFALAELVRPDAILFTASAAAMIVIVRHARTRALVDGLRFSLIPLTAAVVHVAFRKAYYGDWVPNTFHAKMVVSWDRVHQGWEYLSANPGPAVVLLCPFALTIAAGFRSQRRRRRALLVVVPLFVWLSYVAMIGGDIMPRHRHLVPAAALVGLLDVEGLTFLAAGNSYRRLLAIACSFLLPLWMDQSQRGDPTKARVLAERWEWRGRPVGKFLHRAFADMAPVLAVDAAGATPYYAEIDALDMLGLNDRYLAQHPPNDFGKGWLGHELGNGDYVLRRKPDFVLFARPPGASRAMWRGGREMQGSPEFRRLYKLIRFNTRGDDAAEALIWTRIYDSRVGILQYEDRIVIPGFLLSGEPGAAAEQDDEGRLGAKLGKENPGRLSGLPIARGAWRLLVDSHGEVALRVIHQRTGSIQNGASGMWINVESDERAELELLSLEVRPTNASSAHVRSVTLARAPG